MAVTSNFFIFSKTTKLTTATAVWFGEWAGPPITIDPGNYKSVMLVLKTTLLFSWLNKAKHELQFVLKCSSVSDCPSEMVPTVCHKHKRCHYLVNLSEINQELGKAKESGEAIWKTLSRMLLMLEV